MSAAVLHSRTAERQMLDAIGEAVIASDGGDGIVYCNQAAERLYGVAAVDIMGRPVWDLIAPTVADREMREIRARVLEGESWSGTVTGRRDDGSTFPHRVTLSPLSHPDGTLLGMIGVGLDISEELASAAQAQEHDQRLQRVFDESPVAMGLVGLDLTFEQANPALQILLGYSESELTGRTLAEVTHPDDLDENLDNAARLLNGEIPSYQMQRRFIRKDGEEVVGRLTARAVRDEDGAARYLLGTVEDLTATLGAFATIQEQKERLATTLEVAGVCTWDLDLSTLRQEVSDNYGDVLGLPFDEVPTCFDEVLALVHPDDQALFLNPQPYEDAIADRFDVEFRMVRPRGGTIWVGCKGSFERDETDTPVGMRGTLVNLTEQRAAVISRVEAEERYRQTIEAANDAFVGIDTEGRIQEWNKAAERMFGWTEEEILGRLVLQTLIPDDRRERYAEGLDDWAAALRSGQALPERLEMTGLRRDGCSFALEISMVAGADEDGTHIRAFLRDITDRRALERRLADQAVTDALTGLPDRTVLLERLSGGLARLDGHGGAVAVLFIDLDGFKEVNDQLGHEAGDQLLTSVAQRLRSAVRPTDLVARIGGDEFAVVCDDLGRPELASHVADRILASLEAPFPLGDLQRVIGVSIGIASATKAGVVPESVVHHADEAMYEAKKAGGSRHATYQG